MELLNQAFDGLRFWRHIVMHQAEETIVAFDEIEYPIRRPGEPVGLRGSGLHKCAGEVGADVLSDRSGVGLRTQNKEPVQLLICLCSACPQDLVEPVAGPMHDDHGHDGDLFGLLHSSRGYR